MGFAVTLSFLGKLWVPVETFCIMHFGLLGCVPGESSTQTLFLRVMDTFDDDDETASLPDNTHNGEHLGL